MRKYKVFIVTLLLMTVSTSTLAFGKKRKWTEGLDNAGEPCEVLICMSGKLDGTMQPDCTAVNQRFFNIRVFTPYFNPEATARTRQSFLNTCQGAVENRGTLEMVIQRFGRSFQE